MCLVQCGNWVELFMSCNFTFYFYNVATSIKVNTLMPVTESIGNKQNYTNTV